MLQSNNRNSDFQLPNCHAHANFERVLPVIYRNIHSFINVIYIITRVHSSFSLVENRDPLEDKRTADAISVTSQSQPFQNYQQPMTCFVLYRSWSRQMACEISLFVALLYKSLFWQKNFIIYHMKQVDNILPLSVQLQIHGKRHNVVRTSLTTRLVVLTTLWRHTVYLWLNRQRQNIFYLLIIICE